MFPHFSLHHHSLQYLPTSVYIITTTIIIIILPQHPYTVTEGYLEGKEKNKHPPCRITVYGSIWAQANILEGSLLSAFTMACPPDRDPLAIFVKNLQYDVPKERLRKCFEWYGCMGTLGKKPG